MDPATPQSKEATVNIAIPQINIDLLPNISPILPMLTINEVTASKYPKAIHCTLAKLIFNDFSIKHFSCNKLIIYNNQITTDTQEQCVSTTAANITSKLDPSESQTSFQTPCTKTHFTGKHIE